MINISSQRLMHLPQERLDAQVKIAQQTIPVAFLELPVGTIINANVIENKNKFITEIYSNYGKLTVKTNLDLQKNTQITLQISRVSPQLRLIIKKINNVPISTLNLSTNLNKIINTAIESSIKIQNSSQSDKSDAIQARERSSTTPINLGVGATFNAILLRPITEIPSTQGIQSEQDRNSPNIITKYNESKHNLVSSIPQNPVSSVAKTETANNELITNEVTTDKTIGIYSETLMSAKRVLQQTWVKIQKISEIKLDGTYKRIIKEPESTQSSKLENITLLTPGTRFKLKFLGVEKTKTKDLPHTENIPKTFNGIVIATTPTGQPIINSPLGMMAIETTASLYLGQKLRLEIINKQISTSTTNSAISRFETIFQSREWTNLADALHQLDQVTSKNDHKLITPLLPQPNRQLTSNILFFLNALKSGDIYSWLGNAATSMLGQIKPDLLSQLNEDFGLLGRAAMEPQVNDWRTAMIPIFTAMGLEQFRMHTRHHKEESDDEELDDGTRFIIDVSLSQLGRLQLDGLVRRKGRQLDLVIRSDNSLSKKINKDITNIFTNFTKSFDVIGNIIFHADQTFIEIALPQLTDYLNKDVTT